MSNRTMVNTEYGIKSTPKLVVIALLLALAPHHTQAAAPVPGAGSILNQVRPAVPPTPSSSDTGLTIPKSGEAEPSSTVTFLVKQIRITGNRLIDTATLHALVADSEGKQVTLRQLAELAGRITDYYRRQGYPLSRAIVPAQTIQDGVVEIEVVEARYGKVELRNHSRVKDSLLTATVAPLQGGAPVESAPLERSLLLLSDIPGVVASATLKPGQTVGASDLLIDANAGARVLGNVELNDYGNRYTGRGQLSGTVDVVNPFHFGDVLSVSALTSGNNLNYGRLGYDALLDGAGTRAGGSFSTLRYKLGDSLANLDAHGTAQVAGLWLKRPLLRSRNLNLYGQLSYDNKRLKDIVGVSGIETARHLDNWTAELSGDSRDGLLFGGVNTWRFGLTAGRLGFDDAIARLVDAATAGTQGSFSKVGFDFSRLQQLSPSNGLYLALSAQWASGNLDAAERMIAGGPYNVRAYDVGVLSGDSGYFGSIEFRHDFGVHWRGRWQGIAFVDSQHLTINEKPWTAGTNSATLSGAGLGLDWVGPQGWNAKAYVAKPIGGEPALLGGVSDKVRFWLRISKPF